MEQAKQLRKGLDRVRLGHIAVAAFVVGGLAACSSTPTTSTTSAAGAAGAPGAATTATTAASASAASVIVSTAQNSTLGTVLVSGKTLYTLAPSSTPCTAACEQIRPPLVLPAGATKATAGSDVNASNLGTVNVNGVLQVTYSGKPLYTFTEDMTAGQANGNVTDTWGKWSAVVTAEKSAPASSGSKTTSTTAASSGSGGAGF